MGEIWNGIFGGSRDTVVRVCKVGGGEGGPGVDAVVSDSADLLLAHFWNPCTDTGDEESEVF